MEDHEILEQFLKKWEGLRLESYQDVAGVWTIGYGHTQTTRPGQRITEQEALVQLRADMAPALRWARRYRLTAHQTAAIASWAYNVGLQAAERSTLRRCLERGQVEQVPHELRRWTKARVRGRLQPVRGLIRRREAEAALFSAGSEPSIEPAETGARATVEQWLRWIAAGAAIAIQVWQAVRNGHGGHQRP